MPTTSRAPLNSGPRRAGFTAASVWMNARRCHRAATALGAHHADGHAVLRNRTGADGQHPLAHLEVIGIADGHGGQAVGIDLEHAMSVFASRPRICARNSRRSVSFTITSPALATTCALVRIRPSELMMTPEPSPRTGTCMVRAGSPELLLEAAQEELHRVGRIVAAAAGASAPSLPAVTWRMPLTADVHDGRTITPCNLREVGDTDHWHAGRRSRGRAGGSGVGAAGAAWPAPEAAQIVATRAAAMAAGGGEGSSSCSHHGRSCVRGIGAARVAGGRSSISAARDAQRASSTTGTASRTTRN